MPYTYSVHLLGKIHCTGSVLTATLHITGLYVSACSYVAYIVSNLTRIEHMQYTGKVHPSMRYLSLCTHRGGSISQTKTQPSIKVLRPFNTGRTHHTYVAFMVYVCFYLLCGVLCMYAFRGYTGKVLCFVYQAYVTGCG